jgi:predicted AlkP superfamily phosphohydrolase/phosphomutase
MSVLAVVLDAADAGLLRRWVRAGELPVLAHMMEAGASAKLESPAAPMHEAEWVTLTTGTNAGSHGVYHWRAVRPGTYQRTRQPPAACRKACWDVLRDALPEARAVVLDPPYSTPLGDDRITEVLGWGERGAIRHASWPRGLYDEIIHRHGPFPTWTEDDYVRWPLEERRLLRALEDAIERRTTILIELLGRAEWDVGFACYYELHDGGHALFRYVNPGAPGHKARRASFGEDALLRLYKAADTGLGRLRESIGDDADLLVCSSKGFRPNTNGLDVLPKVLQGLGYQVPRRGSRGSRRIVVARSFLRALAPRPLRRKIYGRVPPEERDRMLEQLWIEPVDWARSRAFAESDFGCSWIRLNVRGREPDGIVEPGDEYEHLLAELTDELLQLTHVATGARAVERVIPCEELAPGPNSGMLPDLVVDWTHEVMLDAVHHPRLGVVRERMKDLPTSEHTGDAFMIGSGPRFRPGATTENGHLADIAPTVLHLAGAALPRDMDGRPLSDLLDPSVPEERRKEMDWALDPWALRR